MKTGDITRGVTFTIMISWSRVSCSRTTLVRKWKVWTILRIQIVLRQVPHLYHNRPHREIHSRCFLSNSSKLGSIRVVHLSPHQDHNRQFYHNRISNNSSTQRIASNLTSRSTRAYSNILTHLPCPNNRHLPLCKSSRLLTGIKFKPDQRQISWSQSKITNIIRSIHCGG